MLLFNPMLTTHVRFAARETAVALAFIALSIAMTWPLAPLASVAVLGPADPYVSAFILNWDYNATFHHPLRLFHPPVFYPAMYALAFSEHLYGIALWTFPFFLFGASPITAHSVGMILGFALCGYGAYVLGRLITGSVAAGFVAGVFFAFVPYRFHHLTHISYVWAGWIPLLLAALIHYGRQPSAKRAALFGAVFFMNGLTCLHWFAFGSFAIVLAAIVIGRDWRFFARLAIAVAVAGTLLVPFLLPYRRAAELYGMKRSYAETLPYSAHWRDWFTPPRENKLYGGLTPDEAYEGEHPLFPGFVVLMLSGCALLQRGVETSRAKRILLGTLDVAIIVSAVITILTIAHGSVDWHIGGLRILAVEGSSDPAMACMIFLLIRLVIRVPSIRQPDDEALIAALWIALGILGSFGLRTVFHRFLFDHVPPFQSIRVPARWSTIAYVGLSMLAAIGTAALMRRFVRGRIVLPIAISAALLFECRDAPIHWYLTVPEQPAVYRWLAEVPIHGAVLELPIRELFSDYSSLLGATIHHRPLINGVSSFEPPGFTDLIDAAHREPIPDDLVPRLERRRCSLIIVHVDELYGRRPIVREWLRKELARGRLAFVRRFDHHIWGDYVFALTRCEPQSARWRAPELRDPSGRTPTETLQAFLEQDGFTYNASIFGLHAEPGFFQDVRGDVTVSGWAMSPNGVSSVDLLFDSGRIRVPARLLPAPWVARPMPWYPRTQRPGFTATLPPPPGVPAVSDVQVEIVDGLGQRTRLEDRAFRWSRKRALKPDDWNVTALDAMLVRAGLDPQWRSGVLNRMFTMADLGDRIVTEMKGRPDADFLARAFNVLFNRPPDRVASFRYFEKLARGTWRRDVVDSLIESPEFARLYLRPGVRMEPLR